MSVLDSPLWDLLGSSVVHADCWDAMAVMEDCCIDAIVCDPPYLLNFMGKAFDSQEGAHADPKRMQAWHERWAREALRVLKPGGHLLAFGGTRTYHRLACAVEDAGFEIRDTIAWMYGTGFPKSLNVSKAIDRAAGAEREIVGRRTDGRYAHGFTEAAKKAMGGVVAAESETGFSGEMGVVTRPATPEAERWSGWGTALKPAHEPIVVARKPLRGTVTENVLRHGTGALNIDACRVGTSKDVPASPSRTGGVAYEGNQDGSLQNCDGTSGGFDPDIGRWPANVVLDASAGQMLDAQAGDDRGGKGPASGPTFSGPSSSGSMAGDFKGMGDAPATFHADEGGASRFFFCPDVEQVAQERPVMVRTDTVVDANAMSGPSTGATSNGEVTSLGRWPANVVLDQEAAALLDEQSGECRSSGEYMKGARGGGENDFVGPASINIDGLGGALYADSGGASRFLYCAKTSSAERNAGLDSFDAREAGNFEDDSYVWATDGHGSPRAAPITKRNVHPTVKPVELMRWLVRLVTPPGGVVLDPFAGSGSTGCAAALEKVQFVGVEREAEYVAIARARIAWWEQHPDGVDLVKRLERERERAVVEDSGQGSLFA